MSKTFFQRIHQQRKAADSGQIARVEVDPLTIGVLAEAVVFPLKTIGISAVTIPSIGPAVAVIPPESPALSCVGVVEVLIEGTQPSISPVAAPSFGPAAAAPTPQSPTVGVSATIVSVS